MIEAAATQVFTERGYHDASMDEIAKRSGVSVPVVYDHFESKLSLHRRLLERHFAELRALWARQTGADGTAEERMAGALGAWFAYVQDNPYTSRMLFRDTTGDAEAQAIHSDAAAQSRAALLPLLAREPGAASIAGSGDEGPDMVWEIFRAVLQGLALWWHEHEGVPRERVVSTAMNALWIGLERARAGETWPAAAGQPRP